MRSMLAGRVAVGNGFTDPSHQGRDQRERHRRPLGCACIWHTTSLGTIEYPDLPHRPNPTSLGYEPYDVRLRRLGRSLVTALTSADLRREVDSVLPCLPRLKLSRCVRFTNRFTEPVPGLRIPVVSAGVTSALYYGALVLVTRRWTCHRPGDRAWPCPDPLPNPTAGSGRPPTFPPACRLPTPQILPTWDYQLGKSVAPHRRHLRIS